MAEDQPDPQVGRRTFLGLVGLLAAGSGVTLVAACGGSGSGRREEAAGRGVAVVLHRQEGCSCCATYGDYLRDNGFTVEMNTHDDLEPIRAQYDVPEDGIGCHTSVIEEYVIEGHVPVEAIDRLLAERPAIDGISVIGMPANSPGMGDPNGEPLEILSMQEGHVAPYMSVTTF